MLILIEFRHKRKDYRHQSPAFTSDRKYKEPLNPFRRRKQDENTTKERIFILNNKTGIQMTLAHKWLLMARL